MGNITLEQLLAQLAPRSGQDLLWDIFLYVMFFLNFISLFMIPNKNLPSTLLVALSLLIIVVDKTLVGRGPGRPISPTAVGSGVRGSEGLLVLIMHVGLCILPIIAAAIIRTTRKTQVRAPLILSGIIGGVYFGLFWVLVQNIR